jgi:hypothetical protein
MTNARVARAAFNLITDIGALNSDYWEPPMPQIDAFRKTRLAQEPEMVAAVMSAPERLVGVGFRCWLSGFQTSDIGCWELAWDEMSRAVGPRAAKPLMSDLASWVRAVQDAAERRIEVSPSGCRRFCRDECLAISMVAACQHSSCPAFRACAVALLGSNEIEEAIDCADGFARRLREANQMLSPGSVFMGAGLLTADVKGHG